MPLAVRKDTDQAWASAVSILFEHKGERCCEMIYRAWPSLERSVAGVKVLEEWRKEFKAYYTAGNHIALEIRGHDHFKKIEAGICPYQADSSVSEEGEPMSVGTFHLHEWTVTNEMYELFDMEHQRHRWRDIAHLLVQQKGSGSDDTCPVINVTWYNAWCFAKWCGCRLPTDLEWEHACRAGSKHAFWFGNEEGQLERHAWFGEDWGHGSTHPVGGKTPNPNGLYDMHGNVWEWCDSRYEPVASARVLRGGCWSSNAGNCRSAYRRRFGPGLRYDLIGFRLAAVPRDVGAKSSQEEGASPA